MPTRLLFSVDTEVSLRDKNFDSPDTQIFGKINGQRDYGITYIMDKLAQYGWTCTFFLHVYDVHIWGEDTYREIIDEIKKRNCDVQLHTHVENLEYFTGQSMYSISDYPLDWQKKIIKYGNELLGNWTGQAPTWHRAGNLGANRDTLRACREEGLIGDSSFAYGWQNCADINIGLKQRNRLQKKEDILELPITTFETVRGLKNFRHYDINACIMDELETITKQALAAEMPYLVMLMHSFSFVRRSGNQLVLREADIEKFDRFLEFASKQENLDSVDFGKLAELPDFEKSLSTYDDTKDLRSGFPITYKRSWMHWDKGIKNKVFALAPIGLGLFIVLLILVLWFFLNG